MTGNPVFFVGLHCGSPDRRTTDACSEVTSEVTFQAYKNNRHLRINVSACFVWLPDAVRDENWTIIKQRKSKYEFVSSSSE